MSGGQSELFGQTAGAKSHESSWLLQNKITAFFNITRLKQNLKQTMTSRVLTLDRRVSRSSGNRQDRLQTTDHHHVTWCRTCSEWRARWFVRPPPGFRRRSTSRLRRPDNSLQMKQLNIIKWTVFNKCRLYTADYIGSLKTASGAIERVVCVRGRPIM